MMAIERHKLALQVIKDEKIKKFNKDNNSNRMRLNIVKKCILYNV